MITVHAGDHNDELTKEDKIRLAEEVYKFCLEDLEIEPEDVAVLPK